MADEVVIDSRFNAQGAIQGADELISKFEAVKTKLDDSGSVSNGVDSIRDMFAATRSQLAGFEATANSTAIASAGLATAMTAVGAAAGVAVVAVGAFVGATLAGLQECISTAIELDEKWNNFDKENRFSTIMGDFSEAYDDLKGAIGEEFVPGLKAAIKELTFLVDTAKEGVDYIKENRALFTAIAQTTLGPASNLVIGGAAALEGLGTVKSEAQLRREERRKEEEEVARLQRELNEATKRGIENGREAERQAREEERLGIENRRELERQEREEQRQFEARFGATQAGRSRNGKYAGGELDFGKRENAFASSIEGFDSVFSRIQTAAASTEKPEDKIVKVIESEGETRAQQHEEVKAKMDQSLEALERAATALERQETGLA